MREDSLQSILATRAHDRAPGLPEHFLETEPALPPAVKGCEPITNSVDLPSVKNLA